LAQNLISNKVLAGICGTCSAWLTRELNENNFNFNSSQSNEKMEISVKMQHLNQLNKYENSTLLNTFSQKKMGNFIFSHRTENLEKGYEFSTFKIISKT